VNKRGPIRDKETRERVIDDDDNDEEDGEEDGFIALCSVRKHVIVKIGGAGIRET